MRNEAGVREMKDRNWSPEQSTYSDSETNGDHGSLGGQHVSAVPRLILHTTFKLAE